MRKLLYLAVTVVLAVAGALPVNSAEPMNGLSMSSDETTPDVTVIIYINEYRGNGGWTGEYRINFCPRPHSEETDYIYLSSSHWMIQSNAEVAIPINGKMAVASGSFVLPDNPDDPDGYHNFAPYGPPGPSPYGSLNVMLKGMRTASNNITRFFTLELHIIDKRQNGVPPYKYGVSGIFMDYETHLYTSDMN